MFGKNLYEKVQTKALQQVISYLDKDPDKNIPKILNWLERHDNEKSLENQIRTVRNTLSDPNNNWNKLYKSVWSDIDDGVKNGCLKLYCKRQPDWRQASAQDVKKEKCNIPWAILMDPTSACNLHCIGCWAAEYGNKMNMTLSS
jgi:hypothetical protein